MTRHSQDKDKAGRQRETGADQEQFARVGAGQRPAQILHRTAQQTRAAMGTAIDRGSPEKAVVSVASPVSLEGRKCVVRLNPAWRSSHQA